MANKALIPVERLERTIVLLRGHRVMLDSTLASLYGVEVRALNRAVKRNAERFPLDFMFRLTSEEAEHSRSQSVTLKAEGPETTDDLGSKSQSVTSGSWGGRRKLPYAFTEQGVAMLSSVLRSPRAVQVNVEIMRAFVRLRRLLESNAELAAKLAELEKKYDGQLKIVFDAIRELMTPPEAPKRPIGFGG
jgi:chromosome condensin MukBEF ATPase and DNA-binding subunit MukB